MEYILELPTWWSASSKVRGIPQILNVKNIMYWQLLSQDQGIRDEMLAVFSDDRKQYVVGLNSIKYQ